MGGVAHDVQNVLTRLADLGLPSEVRSRALVVAAEELVFDRVVLSAVDHGALLVDSVHVAPPADSDDLLTLLRDRPVALEYPLIEAEVMRRRRARLVRTNTGQSRGAFEQILGPTDYVVAPIILDGSVLGFLHADRHASEGELRDSDAGELAVFAICFALVFERAVLRQRLRMQRHEMRQVASWAEARAGRLGDPPITLAGASATEEPALSAGLSKTSEHRLTDLLTRREMEVLRLMVNGDTNAAIARNLVLSEGTVKFHVKNILRKLHASNRAEATSRYLRLTLKTGPRPG
jgi:DNA-binding CsgD family transcriptional regulator